MLHAYTHAWWCLSWRFWVCCDTLCSSQRARHAARVTFLPLRIHSGHASPRARCDSWLMAAKAAQCHNHDDPPLLSLLRVGSLGAPHELRSHILAVVRRMLQSITNHDPFCHWSRSQSNWNILKTARSAVARAGHRDTVIRYAICKDKSHCFTFVSWVQETRPAAEIWVDAFSALLIF